MGNQHLKFNPYAAGLIFSGMLVLAGCGSGGGANDVAASASAPAPAPITLSGTAAGGVAIAGGTVNAKCATGSGTATTGADGSYTLTVTGIAPCMLQVTDPKNAANVYYSAVPAGTVTANITPLTSLVVASAIGADPATAYTSFSGTTQANITSTTLTTAVTNVTTALAGLGVTIPAGTNPVTATFTAATETQAGSGLDQQIDVLASKLANANVPFATLVTTVATNNASATAASSAVTTLATNSGISSSTLTVPASGTAAAATCPYATSGNYLVAGPGDKSFAQLSIDFGKLTGADLTNSVPFTITTGVDPNNPCAYSLVTASETLNVRVSQAGLSALSSAPFAATAGTAGTPTALSTSSLGLALPAPATAFAISDFQGTWNMIQWEQKTGNAYWNTSFSQLVIDSAGNVQHFSCAGGTSCAANADSTSTMSVNAADPKGVFTVTDPSDGAVRKFAVYRSANGDMVAFGVTASSPNYSGQYFVASKRVSAPVVRKVGGAFNVAVWNVNNSAGGPIQVASNLTFTVTAVTTAPYTFTRYNGTDTMNTDTIQVDAPRVGMITRDAVAVSATNDAAKAAWIGVNGIGWLAFGSPLTGAPSSTNPIFFGISINTPNQ